jgi:hypothetical protein
VEARQGGAAQGAGLDRSLLDQYCVTCHNDRLKTSGLSLEHLDITETERHAEILEKVAQKLRTGQMPPPGRPRPDRSVVNVFVNSLEGALDAVAAANPNPGRVPARRLNRVEYVNAIRDLLGLEVDGAALLPADTPSLGFDNIADALTMSPTLLSRYMSAATKISRLAVGDSSIRPTRQTYRAQEFAFQTVRMNEDLPFGTHGGLAVRHTFPLDGEYLIKLRLQRNSAANTINGMDREHEIEVRLDRAFLTRFTVGGKYKGPDPGNQLGIPEDDIEGQRLHTYRLEADKGLEVRLSVKAGQRLVAATFTNRDEGVSEQLPLPQRSIKNMVFTEDARDPGIEEIEISGPYGGKPPEETPSRRLLFVCQPARAGDEEGCARKILSTFARRAYRRPVTGADLEPLLALYRGGRKAKDFDTGIARALEGVLSFPAFLFRIESDPETAKPGTYHRVTDLELASRLSFFLWRSVPDDELLDAAANRRLREPAGLAQQVRRMLNDRRSDRWMEDFVGQWLTIRNIQAHDPDPQLFPEFDDNLREAMYRETVLLFEDQVRADRDVRDLVRADYTFLNQRLAEHYGVPMVYGSHFRRVSVADPMRRGILGHASVLTVSSYAHRTSVVLRGKWVLENLLGAPPPAPPPNVPPLKENDAKSKPSSLRERMEQHRRSPVCSSCHQRMDPMGFALENFDAVGKWRTADSGAPINADSVLSDGTKLNGPAGIRELLLSSEEFERTLTEKLMTYGLGRGVEYYDRPSLRKAVREVESQRNSWSSLILAVVNSQPFQMRQVPAAVIAEKQPVGSAALR